MIGSLLVLRRHLLGLLIIGLFSHGHADDTFQRTITVETPGGKKALITQTLRENPDGSYTIIHLAPEELAAEVYGELCAQSGARYLPPGEAEVRISPSTKDGFACADDNNHRP